MRRHSGRKPVYSPTAEEIVAACEEIRKDETEKQLQKRAGAKSEPYSIPEVHVPTKVAEELNKSRSETDLY